MRVQLEPFLRLRGLLAVVSAQLEAFLRQGLPPVPHAPPASFLLQERPPAGNVLQATVALLPAQSPHKYAPLEHFLQKGLSPVPHAPLASILLLRELAPVTHALQATNALLPA